jgi:hypothetical protein
MDSTGLVRGISSSDSNAPLRWSGTAGPSHQARFPEGLARILSSLWYRNTRATHTLFALYTGIPSDRSSGAPLGINMASDG